jgi:PIN domain nuclease of toxin-antitoxin system
VKYLLDTVTWLWSIGPTYRIAAAAREVLENGREEIFLSAATSWELSFKVALGKLQLPAPPGQCIPAFMARQGLRPLAVTHPHALKVYDLDRHHRDPFDRLIIAQAIVENMIVLTSDRVFEKYPVEVLWCGA